MPEETVLSAPSSVSGLNTGGHEGSLSLMSLFVLFQSAASSDGGEYNSFLFSTSCSFSIKAMQDQFDETNFSAHSFCSRLNTRMC